MIDLGYPTSYDFGIKRAKVKVTGSQSAKRRSSSRRVTSIECTVALNFTCVSYAKARLSYRLDVGPSVCPSHAGIA